MVLNRDARLFHSANLSKQCKRVSTICQCPKCPSPGFRDNPLSTALWRHNDNTREAINNRVTWVSSNARFDYIVQ